MKTLEQVRDRAQRDANREGKVLVIYNLNRIGAALFVCRNVKDIDAAKASPSFVEIVNPTGAVGTL